MTSDVCNRCNEPCRVGLSFAAKHPHTGAWLQWRLCVECAKAEGELQDERAQTAIVEAERAGA